MLHASVATLEALELPALLAVLAECCATRLGRRRITTLAPAANRAELDRRRERYEEARVLLVDGVLVAGLEGDPATLLDRLDDPRSILEASDVLQAADLLHLVQRASQRIRTADAVPCPRLIELVTPLPETRPWTERVGRVLDQRGRIRDDASPALIELRRQVGKLRDALSEQLEGTVASQSAHLSEETTPLHEGRVVLLLKSGSRGQLDGLIHGRSGSGRSFYFEPLQAVEGNNRLRAAIEDEEAERSRLFAELVDGLRALAPAVRVAAEIIADLDGLQAAVAFAERTGARQAEISSSGELRVLGARHPLLDPSLAGLRERALGHVGHRDPVVPLDLELGGSERLLVVTGPNAGGKTVALKTVGLLTVATACGLPVPCAKGTRLPVPELVVATVGDEQDLLHDRSTFSARLVRLREAWDAAGPGALVLLDELGSGTDPDEGAALAIALLEHLHAEQTLTLVTTHLTRVAALALETDGATCAAMEFDPQAGRPTFRLLPGTPGASEAIALANRLGLPAEWIARATAQLDPEQRRLRALLEEVEQARIDLADRLAQTAETERALAEAKAGAETEREALARERRTVARRLKAQLEEFQRRVRDDLVASEERLSELMKGGRRRGAVAQVVAELFAEPPAELVVDDELVAAGPIVVGGPVRHRGLGWEGRLVKLARGKAEVSVRGKTMRCLEGDLVAIPTAPHPPTDAKRSSVVATPPTPAVAPELNLVGQRVEVALEQLDRYLDQALLANLDEVRIIHGHGSGRLRSAVRKHLDRHRAVARHHPGDERQGGDGASVAALRD